MAKLVSKGYETNPENHAGRVLFCYFEGTPTREELEAQRGPEELSLPPDLRCPAGQYQNAVADRAGLERWAIFP